MDAGSPQYEVSPLPFAVDEDEALIKAWLEYAYDEDEYGKAEPGDNYFQIQTRGFSLVHEHFCVNYFNRNDREIWRRPSSLVEKRALAQAEFRL